MMLSNKPLLASIFLAASALALSACDDDPSKGVNCVETPEAAECQQIDCEKTPDIKECEVPLDCDETPDHVDCIAACDDIDAVILEALAPKDAVAEFVQPVVTQVDSGFRTLTFKAGGAQDPHKTPRLYLDIETSSFLEITDVEAMEDEVWDIAFDAVGYAYTNSGQTGKGGLRIGTVENIANQREFLALQQPKQADITWETDTFVDEATCEVIRDRFIGVDFLSTAIGPWFNYSFEDHSTNPADNAYVIYNSKDNHHLYKIKFLSYDSATTEIKLGVAEFPCSPENTEAALLEALTPKDSVADAPALLVDEQADYTRLTIDASLGGGAAAAASSWVYVDTRRAEILAISDKEALESSEWDLAFKRSDIRLNSANSGPRGLRVARVEDVTDFIAYPMPDQSAQRTFTWKQDTFIDGYTCDPITFGQGSLQTAFGQWYNYDSTSHNVSAPEDVVFVMYDSADNHNLYKIQIASYASGLYELDVIEYPRRGE